MKVSDEWNYTISLANQGDHQFVISVLSNDPKYEGRKAHACQIILLTFMDTTLQLSFNILWSESDYHQM